MNCFFIMNNEELEPIIDPSIFLATNEQSNNELLVPEEFYSMGEITSLETNSNIDDQFKSFLDGLFPNNFALANSLQHAQDIEGVLNGESFTATDRENRAVQDKQQTTDFSVLYDPDLQSAVSRTATETVNLPQQSTGTSVSSVVAENKETLAYHPLAVMQAEEMAVDGDTLPVPSAKASRRRKRQFSTEEAKQKENERLRLYRKKQKEEKERLKVMVDKLRSENVRLEAKNKELLTTKANMQNTITDLLSKIASLSGTGENSSIDGTAVELLVVGQGTSM